MSRKKGRRGLSCIEGDEDAPIQRVEKDTPKTKETLDTAARNSNININRKTTKTIKQKSEEQLYEYFM